MLDLPSVLIDFLAEYQIPFYLFNREGTPRISQKDMMMI